MDKCARKKSSDPQQEQLRENKSTWNQQCSMVITKLIAFKRGINGRGDKNANIPPSSIKEPLPPQMGSFLSDLSSQYGKLVDQARGIIDEQASYSAHRKQSLTAQEQPAELISEASWWGSRAWSHLSLLRKVSKEHRRLRLGMVSSALESINDLKAFESSILNYKNPDSIPNSITELSRLLYSFNGAFLPMYDKLEMIYRTLSPAEEEVDKKLQEKSKPQKENNENEVDLTKEIVNETSRTSLLEKFNFIFNQLVKIGVVVKYIATLENINKKKKNEIQNIYNKLNQNLNVFHNLTGRTAEEKNLVEMEELGQSIIEEYEDLLEISSEVLGTAPDFHELVKKVPTKISSFYQELQNQEELKKVAEGAVSNWLNKMLMSISPSNISRMKLDLISSSADTRNSFDKLMDLLEDKEKNIVEIKMQLSNTIAKLIELIDQAKKLSKLYMVEIRRKTKKKNYYLTDIKDSDLKKLDDAEKTLRSYL